VAYVLISWILYFLLPSELIVLAFFSNYVTFNPILELLWVSSLTYWSQSCHFWVLYLLCFESFRSFVVWTSSYVSNDISFCWLPPQTLSPHRFHRALFVLRKIDAVVSLHSRLSIEITAYFAKFELRTQCRFGPCCCLWTLPWRIDSCSRLHRLSRIYLHGVYA
jgi:hypothetical protein